MRVLFRSLATPATYDRIDNFSCGFWMKQSFFQWAEKLLQGANHDFCPGFNKYVYWLKEPIGWVTGGAAFSLLIGAFIGPQGFVLAGAFVALLILGAAWPWLSMKGLGCKVHFQQSRSQENEPTQVILEVANRWPIPAFGLMVSGQFLQDLVDPDDVVAVALKRVPAWSVSRFEWNIEPKRRGVLPVDTPELKTGFPFDLWTASKDIEVAGRTIVWPTCASLDGVPELGGNFFNIDGISSTRAGNDGETIGVREYRQGDSIRNIHWSRTAQLNRLIVKERQSFTQKPIGVVIDLSPQHHAGLGQESTYECTIRMAASVIRHLHQHQAHIDLFCVGLPSDVSSRSSNQKGLKPIMDFLSMLPSHEQSASIEGGSKRSVAPGSRDQFTVVIQTAGSDAFLASEKQVLRIVIGDDSGDAISRDSAAVISSPVSGLEELGEQWQGVVHAGH